jgi:hypothetical protein
MKEPKFKVWDSISKKMWDWEKIKDIALVEFINKEHYHLMQFTGLFDKNGKEVYEGYIMKTQTGRIVQVVFERGMFKQLYGIESSVSLVTNCESSETIGNIYQTPELLTK